MKPFQGLTGTDLENWGAEFIKKQLGFPDYVKTPGNIPICTLDPHCAHGENLELDGILRVGKTCVIFELTSQKDDTKGKVRKFIRNANLFANTRHLDIRAKFSLFKIKGRKLDDFSAITNWKYAYINTSPEFDKAPPRRDEFPDIPDVQRELYIFPARHLEYLRQLTELIRLSTRNEFLAALGFSPAELDDDAEDMKLPFIRAENKIITTYARTRADVLFLKFEVDKLLQIARVSRYEGIPLSLDEDHHDHYQRLLIPAKLSNIATKFIANDDRATFPNALTVVLSPECVIHGNLLHIPKKYSSLDIIDGQHRLFAYTHKTVSASTRKHAEILATAIMYRDTDTEEITKSAARLFCEINANQAKVKNNLLYLIAYDVLGERNDVAIAGKVLIECNKGRGSLGDIFLTNSLHSRNKFDQPAVPIVTIVDSDLVPLIKGTKPDGSECCNSVYKAIFGVDKNRRTGQHAEIVSKTKSVLDAFFNHIAREFSKDWVRSTDSCLVSAKYITALIRVLRKALFVDGKHVTDFPVIASELRQRIEAKVGRSGTVLLKKTDSVVPPVKVGLNKIYDFLITP